MNLLSSKYSRYLEVLGSEERVKILELLAGGEMCVQEINSHFFASQATISYHINILKEIGFLKSVKIGKFIYYSLQANNIKDYLKRFVRDFSLCLDNA
ncbi:MAG: metalloregulator ArsR/SmtB family transcription factor [Candidatus Saganbacteria bacterium]|nr:metalloregulator ArsR/SmtB family transcription factor [Candidatus Saganbacteria bacterium]